MRMKLFAGLFVVILLFGQSIQAAEPPIEQMGNNTVRVITYVSNGQAQGSGFVIIVEDLGSTNGTFIDGNKIEVHKPTPLEVGETIAFGSEKIIYRVETGEIPKTVMTVILVPETSDFPDITLREDQRITVGRALIKNPDVSRNHADLWTDRGRVMVEDLGSTNGTFIHGQKLVPKSPMELEKGQRLVFGSEQVVYCIK